MACETETVSVIYYVDAEFDDQSGVLRFGPISTNAKAEDLLIALATRSDCKKATLVKEAQL